MNANTPILTLQGRASANALKKLKAIAKASAANRAWFFADYSMQNIPLHTSFDVLLEGDNKKLLSNKTTIQIVAIIDQFGHKLPSVPEGFKTICRLEFNPNIPTVLKKLTLLNKWQYNPEAITLAQHQGIEVGASDRMLFQLFNIAYREFKQKAIPGQFLNNPTRPEFLKIAKQLLDTDQEDSERLLRAFIQMGKIKQKDGELQLEDVD